MHSSKTQKFTSLDIICNNLSYLKLLTCEHLTFSVINETFFTFIASYGHCHRVSGAVYNSLVKFLGLEKTVTEMVTGCLRTMKTCHICIRWLKSISCLVIQIWDSVYICHDTTLYYVKNILFLLRLL